MAKSIFMVFWVPPWQGPDEPIQLKICYLHREPSIPVEAFDRRLLESLERHRFWERVEFTQNFNTAVGHHRKVFFPLYYTAVHQLLQLFDIQSLLQAMYVGRLFSMLLSFGTAILTYMTARQIFSGPTGPSISLAALSIAGFHPQWSFLSVMVNPDVLVAFLLAVICYQLAKLLNQRENNRIDWVSWTILAAATIAALSTKRTGLVALVISGIGACYALSQRNKLKILIIILGSLLLVFGMLWVSSARVRFIVSQHFLPLLTQNALRFSDWNSNLVFLYLRYLMVQFVSFWYSLGWMVHKLSMGWYAFCAALTAVSALGLIRILRDGVRGQWQASMQGGPLFIALLLWIVSQLAMLAAYGPTSASQMSDPMGRCRFIEITAVSILLPLGLWAMTPVGWRRWAMQSVAAFTVLIQVYLTIGHLIPAFYG